MKKCYRFTNDNNYSSSLCECSETIRTCPSFWLQGKIKYRKIANNTWKWNVGRSLHHNWNNTCFSPSLSFSSTAFGWGDVQINGDPGINPCKYISSHYSVANWKALRNGITSMTDTQNKKNSPAGGFFTMILRAYYDTENRVIHTYSNTSFSLYTSLSTNSTDYWSVVYQIISMA